MILTIVPQVTANAGLDLTTCQDESGIITGASVTPNTTFLWTVITGGGTFKMTLTSTQFTNHLPAK